jgi:hypothetical protein
MARKFCIEFSESMQQIFNISTFNAGQFYSSKLQVYASQKGTVWHVCLYGILMGKTLQLLQEQKQSHMVSLSNMGDELLLVHNQSSGNVTSTGCLGVSCQEIWKLCHGAFPFGNINSMVMKVFLGADSTSNNKGNSCYPEGSVWYPLQFYASSMNSHVVMNARH